MYRILSSLLILCLILPLSFPLHAQEPQGPAPLSQVTQAEIEALLDEMAAGRDRLAPLIDAIDTRPANDWLEQSPEQHLTQRAGDESLESTEQALWQSALEREQAAADRVRGALERANTARSTPQRLNDLMDRIRQSVAPLTAIEAERTIEDIDQDFTTLERRRQQAALELDQKRITLTRLEEQSRSQAETLERLSRERQQAMDQDQTINGAEMNEAQEAASQALIRQADARIIAAQLDAQTLPPRMETLSLEALALELESRWLALRTTQLQRELNERSTEELRNLRADLRRLVNQEPDARARFAGEIQSLNTRFQEIARTQTRIRELQADRERYTRLERELTQTLTNVRERLEVSGLNEALGGLFLEEQRRLRDLDEISYALADIEQELAQARLKSISLREQTVRSSPTPVITAADDRARAGLTRIQQEALAVHLQAEEVLADQLRQADLRARSVVALVDELQQILRETLLWWPSHTPVSLDWAMAAPSAVTSLADPASWREIRWALREVTIGSPVAMLLTLLVVSVLYAWGRGTPSQLRALAEKTRHRFTDHIKLTLLALGWSLVRAAPIPLLLMITSLRLELMPEVEFGVEVLATMLFSASIWWMAGHLVLLFTSTHGVARAHFGWNELTLQRLRRHLTWYLPTQLALILFLALAFAHPSELVFDIFGRLGLLASVIITGLLGWNLLAQPPEGTPFPIPERRRRLLRMTLATATLILATLTLAGYLLTVGELMARIIDTVIVLGLVWLASSLAARALILSETRLLIRRMREQRAKAAAAEGSGIAGAEGGLDIPERHLSLEDVNQQTRTLLRTAAGAGMILALFWAWSDMLPALTWLDGVTLWSRTIVVGDAEILSRVSLQDFLLAGFLGVVFTLAARNLPGLVEILLARSTTLDAAGRYTTTMLLRYVLAVVAVITVFSLLSLRWSELQWMVAALTLGLGFGLQEVVANFVSGLIVLLERPIRVGDTITIGEYSGTVARIRTRATTLVDWDNREVVVPNKNFITERLINWTLSDTTTRLVIPVGVSYDSDVDKVQEILMEVAQENPQVLDDPEPTVFFLNFGDSALTFELRVYVCQLRERLLTISELHHAIIKRFRKEGIEIAYPQMDLHIRDMTPLAATGASLQGGQ
ncbi:MULTISPECIES: mechanosensitive ion channel domain-containing protein [unclassified Ectothiorhodospira]|uniref:mechanosensitive ion channel domain-containing protein n=1 Tax=unclassified Ectothiorhodospira TaxID=2684909 RepID=UPI001EE8FE21|nr:MULTISPECIES: mechanosensitive ion channel domain-containing protein [unclassified Ectothiorhodospira]MCG5515758.1 mechanosensitive ion channel [Ectothiorhodospira sp. 9100]MCG5519149.1 mechanosensitive ion channel [Ectothiorhodospira sp. 9905]